MEKNSWLWLAAFALLSAIELTAEVLDHATLIYLTKPLLMPVLAIWLIRRTPGIRRFLRHTLVAGLLFSMLGDIWMMFSRGSYGPFFFLAGLGSFLITHLCYTGGWLSEVGWKNGFLRRQPYWIAPFALFLLVFLGWLWPGIPSGMYTPVTAYAVVISAMSLSIVNVRGSVGSDVFENMLAGALLFMLSDCLIAVQKFSQPFPGARIIIMLTYLLGQWLLMRGAALHLRRFPEKKVLTTE